MCANLAFIGDVPAEIAAAEIAAIAGFLGAFISWSISKWSIRKDYQYERSKKITEARFQSEFKAIIDLSHYLFLLVNALVEHDVFGTSIDKKQWKTWENEVITILGESAPVIRYVDLNGTGKEYCGVDNVNASLMISRSPEDSGFFGTLGLAVKSFFHTKTEDERKSRLCRASLFTQAEGLLRSCQFYFQKEIKQFEENQDSKKELTIDVICSSYEGLIHCMYCRLDSIETGARDKRRLRFWRALTPRPTKRFQASLRSVCSKTID